MQIEGEGMKKKLTLKELINLIIEMIVSYPSEKSMLIYESLRRLYE